MFRRVRLARRSTPSPFTHRASSALLLIFHMRFVLLYRWDIHLIHPRANGTLVHLPGLEDNSPLPTEPSPSSGIAIDSRASLAHHLPQYNSPLWTEPHFPDHVHDNRTVLLGPKGLPPPTGICTTVLWGAPSTMTAPSEWMRKVPSP